MSKLTGHVYVALRNDDITLSRPQYNQRVSPTVLAVNTVNYSNQLVRKHKSSPVLKSPTKVLKPLPYWVFAGKQDPVDYSATVRNLPNVVTNYWGTTPIKGPMGANIPITYGTKAVGGKIVPDVSQNMINRAETEALNKLSDTKSNVLATVAESAESFNLIVETFTRLVRSLLLAKKGKFAQAFRVLTGQKLRGRDTRASRAWLTYQYALKPAFYDIQGAFELMHQGLKDTPIVEGRRYITSDYGLPRIPLTAVDGSVSGYCRVGVEVCLRAKLDSPIINLLGQMGLYNPFLLAWELIPLSFVIDWLIPIGNSLEALTGTLGLTFAEGYRNTKTVTDLSYWMQPWNNATGTFPGATIENVCQERTIYSSFPVPGLYFKSPFSKSHLISALALFAVLRS